MKRLTSLFVLAILSFAIPAVAEPYTYIVDAQESSVTFETSMVERIIGHAGDITGTLFVDPTAPGDGASAHMSIGARSVKSDNEKRDEHMHRDALESEQYPNITVTTTRVAMAGDSDRAGAPIELEIAATLELHGHSQPITFLAQMQEDDGVLIVDGDTSLLMTEYGITPPRLLFLKVRNLTDIRFHIVARPEAP